MMYTNDMHRTQVLLEERLYESLKSRARKEDKSLGELVREAVATYLGRGEDTKAPGLKSIRGIFGDAGASGRDHDKFLYGKR